MAQRPAEPGTTLLIKKQQLQVQLTHWGSCGTSGAAVAFTPQRHHHHKKCMKHTNPFPQLSPEPAVSLLTMDTAEGDFHHTANWAALDWNWVTEQGQRSHHSLALPWGSLWV